MTSYPSLVVEVTRGPFMESRHVVHAVILQAGTPLAVYGDARRLTFPRSALKPLQALPLVETGAAEAFSVSTEELALACASHSGEDMHTARVAAWLKRLGLTDAALDCGAHAPTAAPCQSPSLLANNCSGKHAGMLTLALFLKAPVAGYLDMGHPVQKSIFERLSHLCQTPITSAVCGVDGCSAPNPAMPLDVLARGFASFLDAHAAAPLMDAMAKHPDLVGGTGRLDTLLMQAAKGAVISKTGAEGVYLGLVRASRTVIVLKADDGATRAAQAALHILLEKHRLVDGAVLDAVRDITLPVLKNWKGRTVGLLREERS